jgi:hypothetical protein
VHIDIEADDVDAEVRRLEALGAKRVHHLKRWWVMQAPTGQRFCVVRPQRPDFKSQANEWDTAAEKGSLTYLKGDHLLLKGTVTFKCDRPLFR